MKALKGSANRATYWLCLAGVVLLYAVLNYFSKKQVAVSEVVLIFVAVPRLHDIDKSGWWTAAVFALEIVFAILSFTMLPLANAMIAMGIFVLLVTFALIWLGSVRGDSGTNRFGEPPANGVSFRSRTQMPSP